LENIKNQIDHELDLNNLPGMVYRCLNVRSWTMKFVSEKSFELTGYTPEELIDDLVVSYEALILPEFRDEVWEKWQTAISNRANIALEYKIKTKDGKIKWVFEQGKAVFSENGAVVFLEGFIGDITEQKKAEEELKLSSEKWEATFDSITDIISVISKDHVFLEINKTGCESLGLEKKDVVGKKCYELVHNNHNPIGGCPCTSCLSEKTMSVNEIFENGRHFLLTAWPLFDKDGEIYAFAHSVKDITDQKKAENELERNRRFLADIIENSGALIFVKDLESRYILINSKWQEVTGLSHEQTLGKSNLELFPGETGKQFHDNDMIVIKSGKLQEFEEVLKQGSSIRYFHSIKFPMKDQLGKITGTCGMATEITDRKKADESIRESEEKYRLIAENMGNSISVLNMDLEYIYVTPNIEKTLGIPADEYMKRGLREAMTPESFAHVMTIFEEEMALEMAGTADPKRSRVTELETYRSDGSTIWMENVSSFIRDKNGVPISVLTVSRDITDRKKAEEEKEKLQNQLIQAQKMESVGRLAGGVAHDFNNMLSVIIGRAELALAKIDDFFPTFYELTEIKNAAERSAELTGQLLAFARKQVVAPKIISLNEIIEKMFGMLKRLIGEDTELQWHPSKELWQIKIDPSQVDQILANLCVNAKDAIKTDGVINIETKNVVMSSLNLNNLPGMVPGEFVLLTVTDNGTGMTPEIMKNIFEPFFTTKEVGRGTGLGLATIYGIVKQNQGYIYAESKPGEGSVFKLYFPRELKRSSEIKTEVNYENPDGSGQTILIVEDEPALLEMCRLMLQNFGYNILTANSPGEAIRIAIEHSGEINMVITDVVMPEMNGRELAKKLTSLYPSIKCLFMSGYTADIIASHGVLNKETNFIQKPFSMKLFGEKVKTLLAGEKKDL